MRHSLSAAAVLFACLAAGPTTAPTTAPASQPTSAPSGAALDWSEAAKHVGETVTVTGPVMGTHAAGKNIVLNLGKDFPAKDRFTVMLPFDAAKGTAEEQFTGKTATVTGTVKLYKKVPEIVAKSADDVKLTKAE